MNTKLPLSFATHKLLLLFCAIVFFLGVAPKVNGQAGPGGCVVDTFGAPRGIVYQIYKVCSDSGNTFVFDSILPGIGGGNIVQWGADSGFASNGYIARGTNFTRTVPTGVTETIWLRTVDTVTGCVGHAYVIVLQVGIIPHVAISPADTLVTPGAMVSLVVTSAGTCFWPTLNTTSSTVQVTAPSANSTYYVIVTGSNGCQVLDSAQINTSDSQGLAPNSIVIYHQLETPVDANPCNNNAYSMQIASNTGSQYTITVEWGTSFDAAGITYAMGPLPTGPGWSVAVGSDGTSFVITVPGSTAIDETITYTLSIPCSAIPLVSQLSTAQIIQNISTNPTGGISNVTIDGSPTNGTLVSSLNSPELTLISGVNENIQIPVGACVTFQTQYANGGTQDYTGKISVSLPITCNGGGGASVTVTSVSITDGVGQTQTISNPSFPVTFNNNVNVPKFPPVGLSTNLLTVTYTICSNNYCIPPGNNCTGNAGLWWGCPGNLCKEVGPVSVIITQSPNRPYVIVNRIVPAACPGDEYEYAWDGSCMNDKEQWSYLIMNMGNATANHVVLDLSNGVSDSHTLIDQSFISVPTPNVVPLPVTSTVLPLPGNYLNGALPAITPASLAFSQCATAVPNPIQDWNLDIGSLEPGQNVELTFWTYRCCPSDVAYNNGVDFNNWQFTAKYALCSGEDQADDDEPLAWLNQSFNITGYPQPTPTYYAYTWANEAGAYIASDDFQSSPDFSLRQSYTPVNQELTGPSREYCAPLEASGQTCCGSCTPFKIQNVYFSQNGGADYGSQIWTSSCAPGGASTITGSNPSGEFRVTFSWGSGTSGSGPALGPAMNMCSTGPVITANGITWKPSSYSPPAFDINTGTSSCVATFQIENTGNFYYDNPVNGVIHPPAFGTSSEFENFFNGSFIEFGLSVCCPLSVASDTMNVTTDFYPQDMSCPNSNCWMHLSEIQFSEFLNCPGCVTPGIIMDHYDLSRINLGYQDPDNCGVPTCGLTPITLYNQGLNPYSEYGQVNVAGSIVGDILQGNACGFFEDGDNTNDGFKFADWQSCYPGTSSLNNFYLEQKITGAGSVGLKVTGATFYYSPISLAGYVSGSLPVAYPLTVGVDCNPVSNNDKFMFYINLNSAAFQASFAQQYPGITLNVSPKDSFQLLVTYEVCTNPTTPVTLSANNYMYLTLGAEDMGGLYPIGTYWPYLGPVDAQMQVGDIWHHNHDILGESLCPPSYGFSPTGNGSGGYSAQYGMFYCDNQLGENTVYDVKSSFTEDWKDNHTCSKNITFTEEYHIDNAGQTHVFPYEYRLVPNIAFTGSSPYSQGPQIGTSPDAAGFSFELPEGYQYTLDRFYTSSPYYCSGYSSASQLWTGFSSLNLSAQPGWILLNNTPMSSWTLPLQTVTTTYFLQANIVNGSNAPTYLAAEAPSEGCIDPVVPTGVYPYAFQDFNNGHLFLGDESFSQTVSFFVTPVCSLATQQISTVPPYTDYGALPDFINGAPCDASMSPETIVYDVQDNGGGGTLTMTDPTIDLVNPSGPTVYNYNVANYQFAVDVEPMGGQPSAVSDFYIYFDKTAFDLANSANGISISSLTESTGQIYPITQTYTAPGTAGPNDQWVVFDVGAMGNSLRTFSVQFTMINCNMADNNISVNFYANYSCSPLTNFNPAAGAGGICPGPVTIPIEVSFPLVHAVMTTYGITGPLVTCGNGTEYTACMQSTENGGVGDIKGSLDLPAGYSIDPCNTYANINNVSYTGSYIGLGVSSIPDGTGGNIWTFDLSTATSFGGPGSVLTGAGLVNGEDVCITFFVVVPCGTQSLPPTRFTFTGYNYCNTQMTSVDWVDAVGVPAGTATFTNQCNPVITLSNPTEVVCNTNNTSTLDYTVLVPFGAGSFNVVWSASPITTPVPASSTLSGGCTNQAVTSGSFTWLAGNTYTVTVASSDNCASSSSSILINNSTQASVTGYTNITCHGYNNGTITLTASGGYPTNDPPADLSYSYSFNNGVTTVPFATVPYTIPNLGPGNYTILVKVIDPDYTQYSTCPVTLHQTITQPNAITSPTHVVTKATCDVSLDGSINFSATGGTGALSYAWSSTLPGYTASTPGISGLNPATYTVTVTDANLCTATFSYTVLTAGYSIVDNWTKPSCYGGSDGSLKITVNNVNGTLPGSATYAYVWPPTTNTGTTTGTNVDTYSPLAAPGPYTVSVTVTYTDGTCTATNMFNNLPQPTQLTIPTPTITNVKCFGATTGAATVAPTGATPGYTYMWASPILSTHNSPTISGQSSGTYYVTVTDTRGCTASTTITITQPATAVTAAINNPTEVLCYGNSTGSATVTALGGTPAAVAPFYTYSWSGGEGHAATASNLTSGTYTVTVYDLNGCQATASVTITQPGAALSTPVVSTTATTCGHTDGTATCGTVTGGTGAGTYTYTWSGTGIGFIPPTQSVTSLNPLPAGIYTVTVTDANMCSISASGTVQNSGVTIGFTVTNEICAKPGSLKATPSEVGLPNTTYSYNWSTGATTPEIDFLMAGTYTVSVTAADQCSATATATITDQNDLNISLTASNCASPGGASLSPNIYSGTAPYNYTWSMAPSASVLQSGTYSVTVTDANCCSASASVSVTYPDPYQPLITPTNSAGCGGQTGALSVAAGNAYQWSSGGVTQTISGLAAGIYYVTVTDASHCSVTAAAAVSDAGTPFTLTPSADPTTCNDASFTVGTSDNLIQNYTVTFSGIQAPTYINGGVEAVDLQQGTRYGVTVYDPVSGCTLEAPFQINPPPTNVQFNETNITCYGVYDGSLKATAMPGIPSDVPYTYFWSTYSTTQTIGPLSAGNYAITVTGASHCTTSADINVWTPLSALAIGFTPSSPSTCSATDGSVTANVTGGTPCYSYLWSTGSILPYITGIGAGTYTVTVTDATNICSVTASVQVLASDGLGASVAITNASCNLPDGSAVITITGGIGPYTISAPFGPVSSNTSAANHLAAGSYTVTVTDGNQCSYALPFTVTNSNVISLSTSSVNATACGVSGPPTSNANGTASVTVTGGSGTYNYTWSGSGSNLPQNGSTAVNLTSGTYTVDVTDGACSASATASVSLTVDNFSASIIQVAGNIPCLAGTALSAQPTGGAPPFRYQWNIPSITAQQISLLLASSSYTVTITDANCCTAVATVPRPSTDAFNVTLQATTAPSTCTSSDGSVTASVSDWEGNGTYTYTWAQYNLANLNGAPYGTPQTLNSNTDQITGLSAGVYFVTVTESTGCSGSSAVALSSSAMSFTPITPATAIGCTPTGPFENLYSTLQGVTSGATYDYYTSSNPSTYVTNPPSYMVEWGTYWELAIYDGTCVAANLNIIKYHIKDNGYILMTENDVSCPGGSNGSVEAIAGSTNGGQLTYNWSGPSVTSSNPPNSEPAGTASVGSNIAAGTYAVTVTDAYGCTANSSIVVNTPAPFHITLTPIAPSSCSDANGVISSTVTGGSPCYGYLWSNTTQSTTPDINGLTSGDYILTITDGNQCTATASVDISATDGLNAHVVTVNSNCGSGGTARINITGGTGIYTVTSVPPNPVFPAVLMTGPFTGYTKVTGLAPGNYSATVSDGTCTFLANFTITDNNTISLTTSSVADGCPGQSNNALPPPPVSNGSATVTVVGPTEPYVYSWAGFTQVGSSLVNVPPGTYNVAVSYGTCSATASITVSSAQDNLSVVTSQLTNNCSKTNIASAAGQNGVPPYSYNWSTGESSSSIWVDWDNMSPGGAYYVSGSYTVTVTDANCCTASASIEVLAGHAVFPSFINVVNPSCSASNGSVECWGSDGFSPPNSFLYHWSNSTTNQTLSNVPAGNYTVTVTSQFTCTAVSVVSLSNAATNFITSDPPPAPANCSSNNPFPNIQSSRPIIWTPPIPTNGLVAPGVYEGIITGPSGCKQALNVDIVPYTIYTVPSETKESCYNQDNGSVQLNTYGSTGPFTYSWSNHTVANPAIGLAPGEYNVTVTDQTGCSCTAASFVAGPTTPLSVSAIGGAVTACNLSDGTAQATASGGTPCYRYLWSNGQATRDASGLAAGNYTVTVFDVNDCTATATVTVPTEDGLSAAVNVNNPTCTTATGSASITISGGMPPYTTAPSSPFSLPSTLHVSTASGLAPGTYVVTITDAIGCTFTATVVINPVPQPIAVSGNVSGSCTGATGSIILTVTGGNTSCPTGYQYHWNDGVTTQNRTGLVAGTYTVTVKDCGSGCTKVASFTVIGAVTVSALANNSCYGETNGSVTATAGGGSGTYTYAWATSAGTPVTGTTNAISNIAAGTYCVTVTSQTCTATTCATVNPLSQIVPNLTSTDNTNCSVTGNGVITEATTGGGGVQPITYNYVWSAPQSPSSGNQNETGSHSIGTAFTTGTYTITITDNNNGCSTTASAMVGATPGTPVLSTSSTPPCSGENLLTATGTAKVVITNYNNSHSYTYTWSGTTQTTASITGLLASTYIVTVEDNTTSCINSATIVIANDPITVSVSFNTNGCGKATAVVPNGSTVSTYLWNNNDSYNPITGLVNNQLYSVTVHDSYMCTASGSGTYNNPNQWSFTQSSSNDCTVLKGAASVTVTPGAGQTLGQFSYQWSLNASPNNLSGRSVTHLLPGVYHCTITGPCATQVVTFNILGGVSVPFSISSLLTDYIACPHSSVTLNVTSGYSNYSWNTGSNTSSTTINNITAQSLSSPNTYSVTAFDNNIGCPLRASYQVFVPGVTVSNDYQTYCVDNTGREATYAQGVNGNYLPTVTVTNDNGQLYNTVWTTTPAPPITYATNGQVGTLTGTTTIGSPTTICTFTTPLNNLTLKADPDFTTKATPASICSGSGNSSTLSLTMVPGSNVYAFYYWEAPLYAITTTPSEVVSPTTLGTHTYNVEAFGLNGCAYTEPVSVSVVRCWWNIGTIQAINGWPEPLLQYPAVESVCSNVRTEVDFTGVTSNGTTGDYIQWSQSPDFSNMQMEPVPANIAVMVAPDSSDTVYIRRLNGNTGVLSDSSYSVAFVTSDRTAPAPPAPQTRYSNTPVTFNFNNVGANACPGDYVAWSTRSDFATAQMALAPVSATLTVDTNTTDTIWFRRQDSLGIVFISEAAFSTGTVYSLESPPSPVPPQSSCGDTPVIFYFGPISGNTSDPDSIEWSLTSSFSNYWSGTDPASIWVSVYPGTTDTIWIRSVDSAGVVSNPIFTTASVTAMPGIPAAPGPQTACADTPVTFTFDSIVAVGCGADWIVWSTTSDFSNPYYAPSPANAFVTVNPGSTDTIWIESYSPASGAVSSATFTTATVTVSPQPPMAPAPQTACSQSAVWFNFSGVTSAGCGADEIEWAYNSSFTDSQVVSSPVDISVLVPPGATDTVWIRSVSSATGAVSSAVFTTASNTGEPGFGAIAGNLVYNCQFGPGDDVSLNVFGGAPPYSFNWSNGAMVQNPTDLPAGIYYVTITDGNGCTDIDTAVVTCNTTCTIDSFSVTCAKCYYMDGDSTHIHHLYSLSFYYDNSNGPTSVQISNLPGTNIGGYTTGIEPGWNNVLLSEILPDTASGTDTFTITLNDTLAGNSCSARTAISLACNATTNFAACNGNLTVLNQGATYTGIDSMNGHRKYMLVLAIINNAPANVAGGLLTATDGFMVTPGPAVGPLLIPGITIDTFYVESAVAMPDSLCLTFGVTDSTFCPLCSTTFCVALPQAVTPCSLTGLTLSCGTCIPYGNIGSEHFWNMTFNYSGSNGSLMYWRTLSGNRFGGDNKTVENGLNVNLVASVSPFTDTLPTDTVIVTVIDSLTGDSCSQAFGFSLVCGQNVLSPGGVSNVLPACPGQYRFNVTGVYPNVVDPNNGQLTYMGAFDFANTSTDTVGLTPVQCGTCVVNDANGGFVAPGVIHDTVYFTPLANTVAQVCYTFGVFNQSICGLCAEEICFNLGTGPCGAAFSMSDTAFCAGDTICINVSGGTQCAVYVDSIAPSTLRFAGATPYPYCGNFNGNNSSGYHNIYVVVSNVTPAGIITCTDTIITHYYLRPYCACGVTVDTCPELVANFGYTIYPGYVILKDKSIGNPTIIEWYVNGQNFVTGPGDTLKYVFAHSGLFEVCQTIHYLIYGSDQCCLKDTCMYIMGSVDTCLILNLTADFSYTQNNNAPYTYTFSPIWPVNEIPSVVTWNFGDSSSVYSDTAIQAIHSFDTAGYYDVCVNEIWFLPGNYCCIDSQCYQVHVGGILPEVRVNPNPFQRTINVEFQVNHAGKVELLVFDALGRVTKTLISSAYYASGYYTMEFDMSDMTDALYNYRFRSADGIFTGKMIKQ